MPESTDIIVNFTAAFDSLIDGLSKASEAFRNFIWRYTYSQTELQPSRRYARAGYPYGRHTRGKKRWLREMRHK